MYSGSRPLAYWFDQELVSATSVDYAEGSAIDRAFLSFLMIIGLVVLWKRRRDVSRILTNNKWLLAFFAYMAFSILWSDYPGVSFKRWTKTVGDLLMVLIVLTEADCLDGMKTIFRRSAFVLLPLSIILIKYFRDIGIAYSDDGSQTMWIGVTTQKNVLGYVAMVCGLSFVHSIVTDRKLRKIWVDLLLLLLALWLLAGSSTAGSKTSLFGFVFGVCVLIAVRRSPKNPGRVGLVVILLALMAVVWTSFGGSLFESAASTLGRDATLTGRTDIWNAVLEVGPRDPLLGRGYGSFWIGDTAAEVWRKPYIYAHIQQSHNGYLDIYLELGILGLALLSCLICSVYRNSLVTLASHFEYGTMRMILLFVILVHNIAESSFGRPVHLLWFLFLLVCTSVPTPRVPSPRQSERQPPSIVINRHAKATPKGRLRAP